MHRVLARVLIATVLVAAASAPAAARNKLVLKVDSVSAAVEHHELVITAKGAVKSGGWAAPCLRVLKGVAKSGEIVVHFLAKPPAKNAVVIQAVVPVKATLTAPVKPGNIVWVKVITETNDIRVPVNAP